MPVAVFPTLAKGAILLSPQRSVAVPVEIVTFMDGHEQRWRSAPILQSWALTVRCNSTDLASVLGFFDTAKGAYDSTWTFGFDGLSSTNCVFESDDAVLQRKVAANLYEISLKIRQCRQSLTQSTAPTSWPSINGGVMTQYPYSETRRWATIVNKMANGMQFAYSKYSSPKRLWNLAYPAITAAEASTLLSAFLNLGGAWREFSLVDPRTGIAFPHCRIDSQAMALTYNARTMGTSVMIAELFA